MLATQVSQHFEYLEAWEHPFLDTVILFFARHTGQWHTQEIRPVLDYILYRKNERAAFSMNGRSLPALRQQMETWHLHMRYGRAAVGGPQSWEPLPVNGFVREMEEPGWQYEIVQLNTARALQEESLSMRHCVATYVERCAKGYCSIWSLRKANPGAGQFDRLITIEVNKQGHVVQARGFANRMPDCAEAGLIRAWCAEAGLRVHGT